MVFFPTLRDIKGYVNLRPTTKIDNLIFQLHYKVTFAVLVFSTLLLAKDAYFGQKIDCHVSGGGVSPPFINHFCWLTGPYTVESALNKKVGVEVAAPGIIHPKAGEKLIHYKYYQWIVFILGLQAACFYSSHLVWKFREAGDLGNIVAPISNLKPDNEPKRPALIERAVNKVCKRKGRFKSYYRFYVLMELCNLLHVILQIYLTDLFLNHFFLTYGVDVVRYYTLSVAQQEKRVNPMTRAFPLLAKCNFHRTGPEGGIETIKPLCQLPLNIINERAFLVIWFTYAFLLMASLYIICYRTLIYFSRSYRRKALFSSGCKYLIDEDCRDVIVHSCNVSDWWVLHMISRNLKDDDFADFVEKLFDQIVDEKDTKEVAPILKHMRKHSEETDRDSEEETEKV